MILKYFLGWFGLMVLAIANGGLRDIGYKPRVGELAAHQISTLTLLLLMAGFIWILSSCWPIESAQQAWLIGAMWCAMTELFEFGLGRLVLKHPWEKLLEAYDVRRGRIWILIPLWALIGPYIFFRLAQIS